MRTAPPFGPMRSSPMCPSVAVGPQPMLTPGRVAVPTMADTSTTLP